MSSALTKALCPLDNQKDTTDSPLPLEACNYGIFGRKGCGKTSLLLNLIMKSESPWYKHFHRIFIISPTAKHDPKIMDLIKDIGQEQYYETLSNEVLEDIIDKIEVIKKKKKKEKKQYCIIYDDCIHLLKKCNMANRLATQNRHHQITNVYLLQKFTGYMNPLIRSNLDLISFFRTENEKELNSLLEEVNGNDKVLRQMYEFSTFEPYSFLHINMYSNPVKYYSRFDRIAFQKK